MSARAAERDPPAARGAAAHVEARRLSRNSLLYLLPTLALRGVTVLLTPLYTRALTPAEYAALGVANTLIPLLAIVFGAALPSAMVRLYQRSDEDRAALLGGAVVFVVVAALAGALVLDVLGTMGWLDGVFRDIPFSPVLRLAVWTAALQGIGPLATAVLMAEERPGRVALVNSVVVAVQLLVTLTLVLVARAGVAGALLGSAAGALAGGLVGARELRARARFTRRSAALLGGALRYSVPLAPHLIAAWVLSLGDRFVLERFVDKTELARYTLAYLFSLAVTVFCGSVTQALHPMLTRLLLAGDAERVVPSLGTKAVAAMALVATAAVSLAPEALRLLAPPVYADAIRYVPWVVLGALFQGVYWVASFGVWFKMESRAVPFITGGVAAAALALNVALVPRFGADAAALVTAVAYALSALLHGVNAARVHPIPWRYGQWLGLLVGAVVLAGAALAASGPPVPVALAKVAVLGGVAVALRRAGLLGASAAPARATISKETRRP